MEKKRYYFIDELRGLALLAMVFTHTVYSMTFVVPFQISLDWYEATLVINPMIQVVFITVCGISCQLSRNNLKRGLMLAGCALLITAATWLVMPGQRILFGILHLLAVCVLLFHFTQKLLNKLPKLPLFAVSLTIFIVMMWKLPSLSYDGSWLLAFVYPSAGFPSADYFPLLPWFFLFLCGTALGRYAKENRFPAWMAQRHVPVLDWVGRHTLIIYMVHQPLIVGILTLIQL